MQIEGFRFYFLLITLASCQLITFAQEDSPLISKSIDSVAADPSDRHNLYFTSAVSDNLVIGSSVSHRQLYYSAAINYFYKNSFYLGASSFHLRDYRPFPAFNTITAGYYHDFSSWLDVNLSLSGYGVHEQLENTLFNSFINTDLKVGIDWNLIYTEFSASRIFGEGSSFFYQVKNSRYVQFPGFSGKKVHISLQPYAELIFGSMVKITFDGNTFTGVKSPTARWGSKTMRENFEMEESPGNGDEESESPGTGDGPGKEDGSGAGDGNNPGQENNSELPVPPGSEQNPGPSENTNPDPGTQNGTQSGPDPNSQPGTQTGSDTNPQTGTQYGSEAGSQTGAQTGEDTGNSTDPSNGQPVEPTDPGPGTDNGAADEKIVPGETDDPSPADQNNETDQGNESDPGKDPDKPGAGPGTKGKSSPDLPGTITRPEWSITDFLGLMEIEIGLPVSITTGRFIFEIEPGYVKSMYNDPYISIPEGFTFMMSVYIKLF